MIWKSMSNIEKLAAILSAIGAGFEDGYLQ
jgi:hypothetical protein